MNNLFDTMRKLHTLCVEAFEYYSVESQWTHLGEEATEYLLAKFREPRGRATEEDILEETVDVFMCSFQMGYVHFGEERFLAMLEKKNAKFAKYIENAKLAPIE